MNKPTPTPTDGAVHPDVAAALDGPALGLSPGLRTRILDEVAGAESRPGEYHLAQFNIARFRKPMDHPDLAGFVEMLDPLNHQADSAPGFVWRLTDEGSNDATSITHYDDPLQLLNLSVWTDVGALRNYVYRTEHAAMVRRRDEWAEAMESNYLVLWWVPAGHRPDVVEADARLELVRAHGPTPEAFTFGTSFPPPNAG